MARYLIAEDAPAARATLRRQVRVADAGATVEEAADGLQALRMCADATYDAVFVSMGLAHGEPGLPLVERLLEDDHHRAVIVCTSMPREHPEVAKAMSLGAFEYLAKPTRVDTVRLVLQELERERGRFSRIT